MAELLAEKQNENKAKVTSLIQTKLAFSVVRSCALCIRGSRGGRRKNETGDIDAAIDVNVLGL